MAPETITEVQTPPPPPEATTRARDDTQDRATARLAPLLFYLVIGVGVALSTNTGRGFLPSLRSELPISDLDGLTVWHQARLEDEDIEKFPTWRPRTCSS